METDNIVLGEHRHSKNENDFLQFITQPIFFQHFFDSIIDSVFISEIFEDGSLSKFLMVNDIACSLLGYSQEELLKKNLYDIKPYSYKNKITKKLKKTIELKNLITETEFITKEGKQIFVETNTNIVTQGERTFLFQIVKDISSRKHFEKQLETTIDKYQRLIDEMLDGVYKSTPDGRIVEANVALVKMLGYESKEELMAVNIKTALYFLEEERIPKDHRVINGVDLYRLKRKDGQEIWVEDSCRFVYDDEGNVQFYEGVLRDVTERKLAEQKIQESSQLIDRIINSINVRVFWKDRDSKYLGCNQFFAEDAGYKKPEELLGKDDYQMAWKEQAHLYRIDDKQVIESGNPKLNIEEPLRNADGKLITLITNKIPLKNAIGEISGVLGTYIDISERKGVELKLERSKLHLQAILQSTADGLLVVGQENEVLFYNERFRQMWNIPFEKAAPKNDKILLDYILDQLIDPQAFIKKVMELYASDEENFDNLLFKDGRQFERYSCSLKNGKEILGRVWSFRDVTEKIKAEAKIVDNELKLRKSESIAQLGYWEYNIGKNVFFSSDGSRKIFGVDRKERTIEELKSFILPEYHTIIDDTIVQLLATEKPLNTEFKIIRQTDKAIRDVLSIAEFHAENKTIFGTIQDITERKKAEIELIKAKETAENNEAFLNQSQRIAKMGSFLNDLRTNEVFWSDGCFRLFGYEPNEIEPSFEFYRKAVHPDDLHIVDETYEKLFKNPRTIKTEIRIIDKQGHIKWTRNSITPLLEDGQIVQLTGIEIDITESKLAEQELAQKDELYRTLFDLSPSGIILMNLDGTFVEVNKAVCQSLGYQPEEMIGKNVRMIVAPERIPTVDADINLLTEGTPLKHYVEDIRKDGTRCMMELNESVITLPNGQQGIIAVTNDITERRKAEEKLRLSEIRNRSLLEAIPDLIFVFDKDGCFVDFHANDEGELLLSPEYFIGKHFSETLPPELATQTAEALQRVFETKQLQDFEYQLEIKGILHYYEARAVYSSEEHTLIIARDVTQNKQAEIEILQAKEKAEQNEIRLIEAQKVAKLGSWETNLLTMEVLWSDETYKIFELNRDDFKNSHPSFLTYVHPEDIQHIKDVFAKSFATKHYNSVQHRIITPSGKLKYVEERWYVIHIEDKPVKAIGTCQDITERILATMEREKIISDIIIRNQELEQFSYIVSHNLRAPVANIMGLNSLLKDNLVSKEEEGEVLEGITSSVEKLDGVIRDLNHVLQTKNEINQPKENVHFEELLTDIKASISNLIVENKVSIVADFDEVKSLTTIKGYLNSIFYNLISNSIKYRQQEVNPIINIKSYQKENAVEIIFTDNGIGFDLSKRKNEVFGIYKRFHTHVEGKGMGLFMVKTQVEALGGKIHVESEVVKGTRFRISFPTGKASN